jgi:hypothetical protein
MAVHLEGSARKTCPPMITVKGAYADEGGDYHYVCRVFPSYADTTLIDQGITVLNTDDKPDHLARFLASHRSRPSYTYVNGVNEPVEVFDTDILMVCGDGTWFALYRKAGWEGMKEFTT